MAGGFDYLDEGASQGGINKKKLSNLQTDQTGMDESPAEGGEGYVGGNSNASSVGFDYVTGKKGSVTNKPIWSQQSSVMGITDNAGSEDGDAKGINGLQDSTDENASYKRVQTDEGLPQTYRNSAGAGDAGVVDSDEPDSRGVNEVRPDTQKIGAEMPQTKFTSNDGGGAPLFKH